MYKVSGDFINDDQGRPFITLGYAPTGRKREILQKICGWLNAEMESREADNFSALVHKQSIHDEFEDEPDFVETKDEYMAQYQREFHEGGKL